MYNFQDKNAASAAGKKSKRGSSKDIVDLRETMKTLVEKNHIKINKWFDQVAKDNPDKALRLYFSLLDFVLPKLDRISYEEMERIKNQKDKDSSGTFYDALTNWVINKNKKDEEEIGKE